MQNFREFLMGRLNEEKLSDAEIKKRAEEKMNKIRAERAKATHCQLCGHELNSPGGAHQSGLCRMCATEHFN